MHYQLIDTSSLDSLVMVNSRDTSLLKRDAVFTFETRKGRLIKMKELDGWYIADRFSPMEIREKVFALMEENYQVSSAELTGRNKEYRVAEPRHVAAYLLHTKGNYSYTQIGVIMGQRDRTSILYAIKTIKGRVKMEVSFREKINRLEAAI